MKIICPGDPKRLKQIKRFECKRCGCIFEADKTEYQYQFSQRENCGWYETTCPTCHCSITMDAAD